jgi:predicted lipid-binding transport protein (Tim44 family)
MNRLLTLTLAALAVGTLVAADFADARRMSGGRSLGAQRSAPAQQAQPQTPPSAAPAQAAPSGAAANPVMPRQGAAQTPAGASAAKAAPGAAAAAPKAGLARWMGPLAGLAAGLGLAALASYLGIADELLSALLIAGLVVVAIVAIRAILARRAPARNAIQYAGAAAGGTGVPRGYETSPPPAFEPSPAAATATAKANVPAGFDVERFLLEAKHQFAHLQAAHDRGDREALADVMTPALFAQVGGDLPATRGGHPTEVVALSADLVEVVTEGSEYWASVRFRGLLREDGEPMPRPLDEVWHLVKPVNGKSGWLLAGIQQGELAGHA